MRDPYLILDVSRDADDDAIHDAWLRLIRAHPPERDAQTFQRIRQAYEALQTQQQRLAYALFDNEPPDVDDLLGLALRDGGKSTGTADSQGNESMIRPDVDLMRQCIRHSLANATTSLPSADA